MEVVSIPEILDIWVEKIFDTTSLEKSWRCQKNYLRDF